MLPKPKTTSKETKKDPNERAKQKNVKRIIDSLESISFSPVRYDAEYYLYNMPKEKRLEIPDEEFLKKSAKRNTNKSCFAQLRDSFPMAYDTLLYVTRPADCVNEKLRQEWADIMVSNKFLPSYVTIENASLGKLILDLKSDELNISLLYVHLSVWRCMREEQAFVKAYVDLYKNHRIDPFLAWAIASTWFIEGPGHNITGIYRRYAGSYKDMTIPMDCVIGLKRYINNPKKYDTRDIHESLSWAGYKAIKHITDAGKDFRNNSILIKDIFNDSVVNILKAKSEREENKLRKSLPNRVPSITYHRC